MRFQVGLQRAGKAQLRMAQRYLTNVHRSGSLRTCCNRGDGCRPLVLNFIGLGGATETIIKLARWPALLIVVTLAIAFLYRYGPSREKPQWRWITSGSAVAAVSWIVVSILFAWYAENFGSFNKTYGSLGLIIGFMLWIWLSTIVVLIGAELNAETEHQTVRDTTMGRPKPLGARGARMADTIGAPQFRSVR
jgi:membrane protein